MPSCGKSARSCRTTTASATRRCRSRWTVNARPGAEYSTQERRHARSQESDERLIHELKLVTNTQSDDRRTQRGREAPLDHPAVTALHDEYPIGPSDRFHVERRIRILSQTRGRDRDAWMICEDLLGRRTAMPILAANEQEAAGFAQAASSFFAFLPSRTWTGSLRPSTTSLSTTISVTPSMSGRSNMVSS